jgi:hypothetical protein
MRSGLSLLFLAFVFLSAPSVFAQQDTCQPYLYYDVSAQTEIFVTPLPTPWFGVRMSTNWVSTVDSAFFGFGINRTVPSTKRDTLEVRVLGNTLPSFTILDRMEFVLMPDFNGQFPDAYYIAEFRFDAPVAWISPYGDFWLTWRIKGVPTDQARIMVKKPALEPQRSVIVNPNGSTILATDFMRTQLALSSTDSVDLMAEARLCYPLGMPVELVSFHATWQNNAAVLEWRTASETNNYGFEILRQAPSHQQAMRIWERIGFVDGHGSTTTQHVYHFVDPDAEAAADSDGIVRYRLRQIDYDGSSDMTHVVEVHTSTAAAAFALYPSYPNPVSLSAAASTVISFSIPGTQYARLDVYDALGRRVMTPVDGQLPAGRHSFELQLSAFRPGPYFIKLNSDEGVLIRRIMLTD